MNKSAARTQGRTPCPGLGSLTIFLENTFCNFFRRLKEARVEKPLRRRFPAAGICKAQSGHAAKRIAGRNVERNVERNAPADFSRLAIPQKISAIKKCFTGNPARRAEIKPHARAMRIHAKNSGAPEKFATEQIRKIRKIRKSRRMPPSAARGWAASFHAHTRKDIPNPRQ
ncbi:MAG: hypothetical protein DBX55_02755 [Verrucomicrobia bacterium]|nr:MAG: hypothetical protein DBX55_02755 [Verrucomicrobiota bacterium]